jgi:hypothetical protein
MGENVSKRQKKFFQRKSGCFVQRMHLQSRADAMPSGDRAHRAHWICVPTL